MKINELIKEVHENAVAHGWWETERPFEEIAALIHAEWSEALEEARAGRPYVWYECSLADRMICDWEKTDCHYRGGKRCTGLHRKPKPEGFAVELIDGVIRILDYFGKAGIKYNDDDELRSLLEYCTLDIDSHTSEVWIVNHLHIVTAYAYVTEDLEERACRLTGVVAAVLLWLESYGIDFENVLTEKHSYNKSREYKHGKLF